ncbi:cytochrome-c peroxidase [Bacterioplanoides sp.]|uniref:cytochrome-c peroxidase n=1 Tax=Bacterioplanoides sp. TaxID=2066072 RepID=UPI003B5CA625
MKYLIPSLLVSTSLLLAACGSDKDNDSNDQPKAAPLACDSSGAAPTGLVLSSTADSKQVLGEALYFDTNLSFNRTQSCASCHNPEKGFVDDRCNISSLNQKFPPASLGANGTSIGDRNAPTAAYMAFSADFKKGSRERAPSQRTSGVGAYDGYLGGQFWDGRAIDLAAQAGGPPTNPAEMGMADKASTVARLQENQHYISSFKTLYGDNVFDDIETAYKAMADSIGKFESGNRSEFYPFDSKYDKSLKGEYFYEPDSLAASGKTLFFSSDFTCAACHQLRNSNTDRGEIFTSFEYHNIGVPENTDLRAVNGVAEDFVDLGLALNPMVPQAEKAANEGKFKVPTMRNVAVTAPYMHNGVFDTLEAVLNFYEHAKIRARQQNDPQLANTVINPETGQAFKAPEVNRNIEHELLGGNDVILTPERIKAFECFFMTLTDKRYESLLDQQKVTECGI